MKAEDTIKEMFETYPNLFIYREDCLDQLFMTIGNGYRWIKGQLVVDQHPYGTDESEYTYVSDYDDTNVNKEKCHQTNELVAKYLAERENNIKTIVEMGNEDEYGEVSRRYKEGKKLHVGWYPYSEAYSAINNIPENIKSDWKEVAIELLGYLKRDGVAISLSDKTKKILDL